MKLVDATKKLGKLISVYKLYGKAFPASEKKPFLLILSRKSKGLTEVLAVEDDNGVFCGLVITAVWGDLVLLDYFAIAESMRGGGIGSRALELIKARYADKRLFLEIEDVSVPSDNSADRLRRKSFYERSGLKPAGLWTDLFGVEMEVLTNGFPLSFKEYYSLYAGVFGEARTKGIRLIREEE